MTKEAPRQLAIFFHALNNNSKPLVINDVSIDKRTKHAYALESGFSKFYAVSPIKSKSGFTLGTFSVFDDEPKTLEHAKFYDLRMLADQFINIYELSIDSVLYDSDISNDSGKIVG